MLEQILLRANLLKAWQRVKANGGAAGIDGVTIEEFPGYLREHWPEIKRQLLDETYKPSPVKRVEIPKRTGGTRPLGIPIVLDRLIQQAILQVLQPIFDRDFPGGISASGPGVQPTAPCVMSGRRLTRVSRSSWM